MAYSTRQRLELKALDAAAARASALPLATLPHHELQPGDEPASTCPDCASDGAIDPEQNRLGHLPRGMTRFSCPCGATWMANTRETVEHGAWLRRMGLSAAVSAPRS